MLPTTTATIGIIGTVLILLLPSTAFASEDNYNNDNKGSGSSTFKVNVYASGINENTGSLDVSVRLEGGARESDNVFASGSGEQFLTQFVFSRGESDTRRKFRSLCNSKQWRTIMQHWS